MLELRLLVCRIRTLHRTTLNFTDFKISHAVLARLVMSTSLNFFVVPAVRLALLRLPLLKRSGESTSRQSAKFKLKQSEIQCSWIKELKISFLLFNFSKPNGFVQRKIAVICFARTNRIFLNESVCRTLCKMTTI